MSELTFIFSAELGEPVLNSVEQVGVGEGILEKCSQRL